ncbi:MAG: hypothetical protein KDK99_19330, partial [Verrucomicrobiales bacterium]|nr:hypothetical protein [Verrucomicrobiales bacterium]
MLAATPEFYWEMEVRQIAAERPRPIWPWTAYDSSKATARLQLADEMDYQAAIKKGSVSADGQARHLERREQLSSLSPSSPALVFSPSDADEFAMYQRGAEDFKRGNKRWSAAEKHWTSLLALPHNQRTFRSTWAAYMLGRLKLLQAEFPQAAQWFQKTRELADTGCIDSLHLAADSLGWEAHCRWKGGELSQAARLYLDQLACGDDTAVTSLRQILRNPNSETTVPTNQHWMDTAKDSVLRRLTTASILSSYSPLWMDRGETVGSIHQWLTIVRQAKLQQVEDAAQLGWLAYTAGDYEAATQWLQLNATPSAASHWLKAKLLRREGRLDQAAEHLSQAIHLLDGAPALTLTSLNPDMTLPGDAARADLAALHLERAEFVGALTAFLEAGKNQDAAYVAERILTPNELRAYVDDHFTQAEAEKSADAPESVAP